MNILVIDIGGTNVKLLATGESTPRKFPSGPTLTPEQMMAGVRELTSDWEYDVVSIGYPGVVHLGKIVEEPKNLGLGWQDFDFEGAFERPVKFLNDAAMQALGSYAGGLLLFLGLGTGLGSALIADGVLVPMELGAVAYKKGVLEDYVGNVGLKRMGKKKWRKQVALAIARLSKAFFPDDIILGGGNAKKLKELPPRCRLGNNALAFVGGYRLWERNPHSDFNSAQTHINPDWNLLGNG